MSRAIVICEGPTEQEFCREVLGPHLSAYGVWIDAPTLQHSNGGDVRWAPVKKQIQLHSNREPNACITTMIDYYGMAERWKWPLSQLARQEPHIRKKVAILEQGIRDHFNHITPTRLIPYLQLHEFEALLFAGPEVIAKYSALDNNTMLSRLGDILNVCVEPELINDSRQTSPSHRLFTLDPSISKTVYGPLILAEIGIPRIRAACPHFCQWLSKLEALGS